MKRVLIDYKKLARPLASRLIESYPDGYGDDDIISFMNSKGQLIEAVELRTEDTLFLVKISKSLATFMANFDEEFEKELATENSTLENTMKMAAQLKSEERPQTELD